MNHRNLMKCKQLGVTFLAVTAFTVGCKPPAEPGTTETSDTTGQQLDKAKEATQEAAQAMHDYAYAQKAEFVAQMQGRLDTLNQDLDQLAAEIEESSDAVKAEVQPKIDALRAQATKLTQQLDVAKNATESTWGEVKDGFTKGYNELKDGFQQARQWVSDKIAP